MRTRRILITMYLLVGLACFAQDDATQETKRLIEIRNQPMTFFGKVVDERGHPIPTAKVFMSAERETFVPNESSVKQFSLHRYLATTDERGEFVIKNVVGWRFFMERIEADGYIFHTEKQPSLYFYPVTHPSQLKAQYFFRQNTKFPVVFVLARDRPDR